MTTYVLRDEGVLARCLSHTSQLPTDGSLEVVIRKHDPKRTEPQHRKFRAMVRELLAWAYENVEGYNGDFDSLYEEMGERFFGTKDIHKLDGSLKSVRRSNKELSKDEMEAAITRLDVFMAERGCVSEGNWS